MKRRSRKSRAIRFSCRWLSSLKSGTRLRLVGDVCHLGEFMSARADQPLDRCGHLCCLLVAALANAVLDVILEDLERDPSSAARVAEIWVRMSMQYRSSSIICCRPRTWPSVRFSRRISASFWSVRT